MITKRADILFDTGKFDKSTMCYDAALKIDLSEIKEKLVELGLFFKGSSADYASEDDYTSPTFSDEQHMIEIGRASCRERV